MPKYEIKGRGKDTGRKRTRIYWASTENDARQLAEEDGTLVEEIIELPPEPATERQLEYAKDLGISIPPNATKNNLSSLISLKLDNDKPSTERHRGFARIYGIEVDDYIGKKSLFDLIQTVLIAQGREKELLSWFAFRVYRELAHGATTAPIESPDDPIIEAIAEELATDEKIVKSVRRYEGRELIWFGEWTSPDGRVHTGGSNRTMAYTRVSAMLKERASFPQKSQEKASLSGKEKNLNKKIASKPTEGKMKKCYCHSCRRYVGFKRHLSIGTIVAIICTGGLWLLAIPLYPKRCIICGQEISAVSSSNSSSKTGLKSRCPDCEYNQDKYDINEYCSKCDEGSLFKRRGS